MIQQFTRFGYSCIATTANITSSYSVVALSNLAANKKSTAVPDDCFLDSIELQLSGIDATTDTVTIFLSRDSAGLIPITSDELSGASQKVTTSVSDATTGGVSFTIGKDYHFDTTVTNATSGTLYLCVKTNASHTVEKAWLNWRA